MCTITTFEEMHSHLKARGSSFPSASRPIHRFLPSSFDDSCCNGSVRLRPSVSGAVCPSGQRHVLVFASTFFVFPQVSFFFFCICFSNDFFGAFYLGGTKRSSLINNFSSAICWIRARIALLSPPSPSQGGVNPFSQ